MKRISWWQCGLIGAVVLSVATIEKLIKSVLMFSPVEFSWYGLLCFQLLIFAVGFICGFILWLALPLSRKLGRLGDGIIGIVTMEFFFLICMIIFDPSMLMPDPLKALPMLGMAMVFGFLLGMWMGRD